MSILFPFGYLNHVRTYNVTCSDPSGGETRTFSKSASIRCMFRAFNFRELYTCPQKIVQISKEWNHLNLSFMLRSIGAERDSLGFKVYA